MHYNGDSSYLFDNGKGIINFKAKGSEIVPYPLCLGAFSKDYVGYIRTTGLSVDDWAIANDKILDIQKYLMEKNGIK